MLSRSTQVGEFYVMRPPPFPPKAGVTGFMDIFLYDEEGDRHVRIKWKDALKATGAEYLITGAAAGTSMPEVKIFKKNNDTDDINAKDGKGPVSGGFDAPAGTFQAWYYHAKWLEYVNENGLEETHYAEWKASYTEKNNIYIVIAKPFIEHLMHSAIAMVSGRDTGATLFGPAGESTLSAVPRRHSDPPPARLVDMQISANTQVKTIEVSGAAALTNSRPAPRPCSSPLTTTTTQPEPITRHPLFVTTDHHHNPT